MKFLSDLIECGRLNKRETIRRLILTSVSPADVAAKLASKLKLLSEEKKEIEKELSETREFCETILFDLLTIIASSKNVENLLISADNQGTEFIDVLINCEQKKVISHFAVQQYLNDLWDSNMKMNGIIIFLVFLCTLFIPIIWFVLSLPISIRLKKDGIIINQIPIIKFITIFVSHLYFIILLILTCVQPIVPISSNVNSINLTNYNEWVLLVWISGLVVSELISFNDKSGFGMLKIFVLLITTLACLLNVISFFLNANDYERYILLFARNMLLAMTIFISVYQLLDLLKFQFLFGPWAIMLRFIVNDFLRLLVLYLIFAFGFACLITALYQDVYPTYDGSVSIDDTNSLKNPLNTLRMLFFSLFGLVDPTTMPDQIRSPEITIYMQKLAFGSYMMIANIICLNSYTAMVSSTVERFKVELDVEWKFSRAKSMRSTSLQSNGVTPFILFTHFFKVLNGLIKFRGKFQVFITFFLKAFEIINTYIIFNR